MTFSKERKKWLLGVLKDHEAKLIRYAFRILKDEERAKDVVQDSFLKLLKSKEGSEIEDHITPWLFTVCRNLAIDILRKEKNMVPLDKATYNKSDGKPLASTNLENKQSINKILQVLDSLPPNEQEVIQLKFQNDLSYKEIAEITGYSVSNVGFLIHSGIKKMRQSMKSNTTSSKGGI